MNKIPKVLFLSRGSASRGQMAEGFLRALAGEQYIPLSAGTEAAEVHPLALEVMAEAGVDISAQQPREIASLFRDTFNCVVVLCDETRERYPVYPFTRNLIKWSVPDPEFAVQDPVAKKQAFRQIRDQMRGRVEQLIQTMNQPNSSFPMARAVAA